MSVIRKPQKADGKMMQAIALIRGSTTFALNLNELHASPNATERPATTVDWHYLAASKTQYRLTYKRSKCENTVEMPAGDLVLPPSEGRNPLTMIKERLPAGSFRGTKTIRLTGGSGMTLRHFLGRLPDGGSGGDLEVSRARADVAGFRLRRSSAS